jgi:crotonobetainyl-CoA:carnitine CoA-transferase CaiB-like acyl-CoA transferase
MPALCGYPNGAPVLQGPLLADPLGGLNGAIALSLALYAREQTGEGTSIEVAQAEALTPLIGSALLDWQLNGRNRGRTGDLLQGDAPSGCYRCRGTDSWLVVSACSNEEWLALCGILDRADLRDDPLLQDATGRIEYQVRIDKAIADWTADKDAHEAMQLLQEAGVTAGCVNDAVDLLSDPQAIAAGAFVEIDHPVAGRHPYPGVTVEMSATPGRIRRHAPLFSQDTDVVLRTLLGLTDDDLAKLRDANIIADMPNL